MILIQFLSFFPPLCVALQYCLRKLPEATGGIVFENLSQCRSKCAISGHTGETIRLRNNLFPGNPPERFHKRLLVEIVHLHKSCHTAEHVSGNRPALPRPGAMEQLQHPLVHLAAQIEEHFERCAGGYNTAIAGN